LIAFRTNVKSLSYGLPALASIFARIVIQPDLASLLNNLRRRRSLAGRTLSSPRRPVLRRRNRIRRSLKT